MSHVLQAVDKLTADMQELREYTRENNKVVNAMLHRFELNDEQFSKNDQRFEKQNQQFDQRFEKHNQRFEKHNQQFEKHNQRFQKQQVQMNQLIQVVQKDQELRDAQFKFLVEEIKRS